MYHKKDGTSCTKEEWANEGADVVGYVEPIEGTVIFSRFTGLQNQIYETGVSSDKEKYNNKHYIFDSRAACESKHNQLIASIQADEDI